MSPTLYFTMLAVLFASGIVGYNAAQKTPDKDSPGVEAFSIGIIITVVLMAAVGIAAYVPWSA